MLIGSKGDELQKTKKGNNRQKSVNVPQPYAFGGWIGTGTGFGQRKVPLDWQLLLEYAANGVVRACVDLNGKAVADVCKHVYRSAPLATVRRSKRVGGGTLKHLRSKSFARKSAADHAVVEVEEHPLADLLRRAETEFQFSFLTSVYLDVLGRAFWFKELNPVSGQPDRLIPLEPQCLRETTDESGTAVRYTYTVNGSAADTFSAERVIAFQPARLGVAKSPLAAVYAQAALSTKLLDYENTLLDNRARPELILNPKGDAGLDEDAAKRLLQSFKQKFRGKGNGEPFVPPFPIDIFPLTFTPTDLGPLQIRQETLRETCAALGVPEPLIHGNAATYSNLKAAIAQHARSSVSPRVTLIENVLNDQLVPDFGDEQLFVAYDNAVPADDEAELRERDADLRALAVAVPFGVVFVNELRAAAGLEPVPGGDDAFVTPMTAAAAPPEPPPENEGDVSPPDEEQDVETAAHPKGLDFDLLLKVNEAVSGGRLARAVAINVVARAFAVGDTEAKQLVGFPVVAPRTENITTSESQGEHGHAHDQEGVRDRVEGGRGEAGSAGDHQHERD